MHRLHDQLKHASVGAVIQHGTTVVNFQPTWPGVDVPEFLKGGVAGSPIVTLNFSPHFTEPTDLHLDMTGISQTLTFEGHPHKCFIPWGAVVSFQNEDVGMASVWKPLEPVDIPKKAGLKLVH